ncbi:SPW repeat protein [Halopiger goleimassiliensis]|uniref:SPW repeat protein n=1 Tax=Halopiger goleimassiliensis TaxID=1293048 RepID=UPI000677FA30|nr:SPW repeat protein [Halopiger goleimassiliensis]
MTRPTWDADEHAPDRKHDERGHDEGEPTDRDTIEHEPNPGRRGRWLAALVAVLGAALIGQAIVLETPASAFWNEVLVGATLVALGAYNYYRRSKRELGSASVAMLAAVLGAWLVASPFAIGDGGTLEASAWPPIVIGLLAIVLGSYSAVATRRRRRNADARPTAVYDRRGQ